MGVLWHTPSLVRHQDVLVPSNIVETKSMTLICERHFRLEKKCVTQFDVLLPFL